MNRFSRIFPRRRFTEELSLEVCAHLEERMAELIEAGMDPTQARTRTYREFGNVGLVLEDSRAVWTYRWLESLTRDVHYAFRALARQKGFAAAACVTLALGVGASVAILELIDGLWLRPLGGAQGHEIVRLFGVTSHGRQHLFSYPEYEAFAHDTSAFQSLIAVGRRGVRIARPDGTRPLFLVNVVSGNLFEAFGIRAVVGRLVDGTDERFPPPNDRVVILGHSFWQRQFGGDPGVIGSSLRIESGQGTSLLTITGVLPAEFRDIETGDDRDLWLPVQTALQIFPRANFEARDRRWFTLLGRLASAASADQATTQVATVAARLARIWPASNTDRGAVVVSDLRYRLENAGMNGVVLLAVALAALLLCCVNVISLLLARNLSRRQELAIRVALGIDRLGLVRQLMVEHAVLGITGVVLGITLGAALIQVLPSLFVPAPGLAYARHFALNTRVVVIAAATAILAVALFGLVPSWRASDLQLVPALRGTGVTGSHSHGAYRVRRWLVVIQIGVSVVLLSGSGVFTKSLMNSRSARSGVSQTPLLVAWLGGAGEREAHVYREIVDRLRALPGVRDVAYATRVSLSLSGGGMMQRVSLPRSASLAGEPPVEVKFNSISTNFLRVTGVPIVRGRGFTDLDQTSGPPVALINEHGAARFWPDDDPVGKIIRTVETGVDHLIVGVTRNTPIDTIGEAPEPYIYLPFHRTPSREVTVVVSAGTNSAALAQPLRRALVSINPQLDPLTLTTMRDLIRFSTARTQLVTQLVSALAVFALLFTAVGLCGVVSFGVHQRISEIALRRALGAQRSEILALILRDVASLAWLGAVIGIPAALAATRLASALLFGVRPWDPGSLIVALVIPTLVVFAAGSYPAYLATRIAPLQGLRCE